jgi:tricorn protease-like protein
LGNPVLILPFEPALYVVRSDRSIWRMNLPDGRQQKLRGALPGVTSTRYLNFSPDGKEIVFINRQSRSKLVMIENLFQ